MLSGPIRLARPAGANRIFGAEITAYIDAEALTVEWEGDDDMAQLLEEVVGRVVDALVEFVEQPAGATDRFALAGLDDAGLDKLAALLESGESGPPR